jgi:hypothetical protein
MRLPQLKRRVNISLLAVLALNLALWGGSRHFYAKWAGVPPVPTKAGAVMMTLGDPELAYRTGALTLQHLGDGGGMVTPLKDYDYNALGKWLWLLDSLDPASEHVPYIAAYYFAGVQKEAWGKCAVLVDYLGTVGNSPVGEKWRWLAQAVYLARHRLNDLHRALDLAYKLSHIRPLGGPLPSWAVQMPAFVLRDQGEKEASKELMEAQLLSEKDLPQDEVDFMTRFLIQQLGVPREEVDSLLLRRAQKP